MEFNDKFETDKKAEIAKKRDDKAERLRKCQQCLVDKLSALNSDQGEYEELMIRLALDEQDEKEKQKEKVFNLWKIQALKKVGIDFKIDPNSTLK